MPSASSNKFRRQNQKFRYESDQALTSVHIRPVTSGHYCPTITATPEGSVDGGDFRGTNEVQFADEIRTCGPWPRYVMANIADNLKVATDRR